MTQSMNEATRSGLQIVIPGRGTLTLRHIVLDLNGTLACDGLLLPGVAERVAALRTHLDIHVLTAGSHGLLEEAAQALGVQPLLIGTGEEKRAHVLSLGPEEVVAMGNGANDVPMLREAALSIVVLGPEGLNVEAMQAAQIVVSDPCAGFDLLLHPTRLVATLRP